MCLCLKFDAKEIDYDQRKVEETNQRKFQIREATLLSGKKEQAHGTKSLLRTVFDSRCSLVRLQNKSELQIMTSDYLVSDYLDSKYRKL